MTNRDNPKKGINMENNFYDSHYYNGVSVGKKNRSGTHSDKQTKFLKGLINLENQKKLLDLGCGTGCFLESLNDAQIDSWGIDISRKATDIAKGRVSKPEQIVCENAQVLPFKDSEFDCVTAWGTVEHFPDTSLILEEIKRVAKKDATIFIMVPNAYYYKFVWDTLRKGTGPQKHQEIEFLYSYGEWKKIIESAGLSVINTLRHNKFNKNSFVIWLRNRVVPFYLSNHFVFICKK